MKRYAILIGVSEFQEYSQMPCAANDAQGMAELLSSPEYGLFTDTAPVIFNQHSDAEIRQSIHKVFKEAGSKDEILLYYSGHGVVDEHGQLHLVTANTKQNLIELLPSRQN